MIDENFADMLLQDGRKPTRMPGTTISEILTLILLYHQSTCKIFEETGNIKPSSGCQKGHSHKIKDFDGFIKFLDANQDITVEKIVEKLCNMCKNTSYN